MINYHAVLIGEEGTEFGHSFRAASRDAARQYLFDNFPESRCVQLEDPHDTSERERAIYARMSWELDNNEEYY